MANYYRELEDSGANYEEEEAQLWREPIYSRQRQRFDGHNHNNDAISSHIRRMPDEVWLIPANIDAKKILGEKKANLQRIEASTNTHMNYNDSDAQIEMWGNRDELAEAIKQWNTLAQNILDDELRRTREARKAREEKNKSAWAKPEKELTEKQRRKLKRREERAAKEKEMAGPNFPRDRMPYNAHFVLPTNNEIPIEQILGDKEDVLNSIRMDTNCYMFYDPVLKLVKIAGNESDLVEEAAMRVKVLYLKSVARRSIPINLNDKSKRNGWVHHMIDIPDIPRQPYRVRIANMPDGFMPPHDVDTKTAIKNFEPVRDGGDPTTVVKENDPKESSVDLETLQRIQLENVEGIKNALLQALGAIHLLDEEIKMRIRFGQICLTDYPKETLWPIDKLNAKVLKSPKLNSNIATNNEQLKGLFEVVSQGDQQWEGSPFREYKIRAYMRPKSRGDPKLDCVFDVKFKNDNKIGLWNATMTERNVLNVNMACLDYDYSWNFSIRTAKRLNNDKFGPQGNFSQISPNNKLIYTNTEDIVVTSVCEKLKWKFWWGDNYVIEITRYEHWNCDNKFQTIPPGVEIVLGREPSQNTFFGVTRDFAENCNLSSGRVPEWHPIDFVEEEKSGGVDHLLNEIRNFLDVLHNNVSKAQRN
ncbi:18629_t:CDS:10 [Racocetra persica]|uniref:18629_t:CDS:1 n=1 Tax=Racocetra persica TaxID=160502 RepID=A0ACA9LGH1_9GLOM|nr:18629_t:CDS:10 [Racocetra persica]